MHHFDGEFESFNKYSADHAKEAWEDIDQVLLRISDSNGKLVAHARRHPIIDGREDLSKWEYTQTTVMGNQVDTSMDNYLDNVNGMEIDDQ